MTEGNRKKLRSGHDALLFEQLQAEQCVLVPLSLHFFEADIVINDKENFRVKGINFVNAKKHTQIDLGGGVALMQ